MKKENYEEYDCFDCKYNQHEHRIIIAIIIWLLLSGLALDGAHWWCTHSWHARVLICGVVVLLMRAPVPNSSWI